MGTELQLGGGRGQRALGNGATRREGRSGTGRKPDRDGLRVVLFDESPEAFAQFCDGLAGALSPKDAMETLLVERIAICAWRLRRIYRIESGLFEKARTSWHDGQIKRTRDIELVFLRFTAHDDDLAKLTRYETSLERSLYRAVDAFHRYQLRQIQASRIGPALFPYVGAERPR